MKHAYSLADASEINLMVCNTIGGVLSLGLYGLLKGRQGKHSVREYLHSFVPMGMMAGGDLGVMIASRFGPISIVVPLTGAYPVVTLAFAALILKERISTLQYGCVAAIIAGMALCRSSARRSDRLAATHGTKTISKAAADNVGIVFARRRGNTAELEQQGKSTADRDSDAV